MKVGYVDVLNRRSLPKCKFLERAILMLVLYEPYRYSYEYDAPISVRNILQLLELLLYVS